jgi:hypothetical protein
MNAWVPYDEHANEALEAAYSKRASADSRRALVEGDSNAGSEIFELEIEPQEGSSRPKPTSYLVSLDECFQVYLCTCLYYYMLNALYMCPDATVYYMYTGQHKYGGVPSDNTVLVVLPAKRRPFATLHAARRCRHGGRVLVCVSLLCMCAHTSVYCRRRGGVSQRVLILQYMCPHTTLYVSSYYCVGVLILGVHCRHRGGVSQRVV